MIECYIITYDITKRSTFDNLDIWINTLEKNKTYFQFILVGNKSDLEDLREVTKEEGQQLAQQLGCCFFETSALEDVNIDKVFEILILSRYINLKDFKKETVKAKAKETLMDKF
mmetsp:Transcript_26276/g.23246  ORF Transcript_26276/g.23246 Transcript_26276/m.23246 type:complete len:114 (+) Transcript_26276:409-750(+)